MKESVSIYDPNKHSYVDVHGIIHVSGQEESNILDCRKYYPGYVNGILRDGSGRTYKTPEGFSYNDGAPVAFFRGRTLIAIGYVPTGE